MSVSEGPFNIMRVGPCNMSIRVGPCNMSMRVGPAIQQVN